MSAARNKKQTFSRHSFQMPQLKIKIVKFWRIIRFFTAIVARKFKTYDPVKCL